MIKTPMWLKKVQTNITRSLYRDMESFERDVMQIWKNARIYNVDGSPIFELANNLEAVFQKAYQDKLSELNPSGGNSLQDSKPATPQPSGGPKLKLKVGKIKAGRGGRRGQAQSDDESEEEDAHMTDGSD
jgi:hypothetical protein